MKRNQIAVYVINIIIIIIVNNKLNSFSLVLLHHGNYKYYGYDYYYTINLSHLYYSKIWKKNTYVTLLFKYVYIYVILEVK